MPNFAYRIMTEAGQIESGVLEANDQSAASGSLRQAGNMVLTLEETTAPSPAAEAGAGLRPARSVASGGRSLPLLRPRKATLEVALMQLAIMLRSGQTLLEALRATGAQSSPLMRGVLNDLAAQVQAGRTLSQALEKHPWMGRMVRQLVEVGEQTGTLDVVLQRASEALERRRLLIGQAIAALMYPALVFLLALVATGFMLVVAIPELTKYLTMLGKPLPEMTQNLVDISNFVLTYWTVMLGTAVLGGVAFAVAYTTPAGRYAIDSVFLRIPIIGYILRTSSTAMFARSFALLVASGVTIVEALRTCQDLHRNRRLSVLIAKARERVISGGTLAPAMAAKGSFMPMLASMVDIGERSGNLDDTLISCATFHEQRLTSLIRTLSSFMEIVVIVFVGGLVGYVYMAFMMALYGGT